MEDKAMLGICWFCQQQYLHFLGEVTEVLLVGFR